MDFNLIYVRTAAGDEAMRERALVVQRDMRMLLILIDGKASVADLCAKTGNGQLAENALRELERGGFIAPLTAQNPLMAESRDVEQEIASAALEQSSQFSTFGTKSEPMAEAATLPAVSPAPKSEPAALVVEELPPRPVDAKPASADKPSEKEKTPVRPGFLERLKRMLDKHEAQASKRDARIKPFRLGGAKAGLTWPALAFIGLSGLLVVVLLLAVLFPYGRYLPEVEAALAQASGQATRVGELRVGFYPKPGLFLNDVRFGNEAEGQTVRIAELRLIPDPLSLMQPKKQLRVLELSGVTLSAESVGGLSGVLDALAQPSSPVRIQRLVLEKADVSLNGLGFAGMSGEVKLATDGRFDTLVLRSEDRSMQVDAKSVAGGLDIVLEGFGWRPSPDSPFLFDSLSANGRLEGSVLSFANITLRLFDGLVRGPVVLRTSAKPVMEGDLIFERINFKRFAAATGLGQTLEGDAGGTMRFAAAADAWSGIFSGLQAEGDFAIGRGLLNGFDLAEAARRASNAPMGGGTTRFEQMRGRFRVAPDGCRFSSVTMTSGLMQSTGQLMVGKDFQLNGSLEMQMRGTVNQMHVPVAVSGTLSAPLLQAVQR